MQIRKITVLQTNHGCDLVMVHIENLPSATWPFSGDLIMKFDAAAGKGPDYVRNYFQVEPTIIKDM